MNGMIAILAIYTKDNNHAFNYDKINNIAYNIKRMTVELTIGIFIIVFLVSVTYVFLKKPSTEAKNPKNKKPKGSTKKPGSKGNSKEEPKEEPKPKKKAKQRSKT